MSPTAPRQIRHGSGFELDATTGSGQPSQSSASNSAWTETVLSQN